MSKSGYPVERHYKIKLNEIDICADKIAERIVRLIDAKKIDTSRLMVMVGEIHPEIGHAYFQKALMNALFHHADLKNHFIELPPFFEDYYRPQTVKNDWLATVDKIEKAGFYHGSGTLVSANALQLGLHYHAVDLIAEGGASLSGPVPQKYQERCKNHPYFNVFYDIPKLFTTIQKNNGGEMLQRDLTMAFRIDEIMRHHSGLSLGTFGVYHLFNPNRKTHTSLSTMFLQLGYELITIVLSCTGDTEAKKTYGKYRSYLHREDPKVLRRYHAAFRVTMPDTRKRLGKATQKYFYHLNDHQNPASL